ncbi:hypothetical protein BCR44DRAFT_1433876 [Catenaria anguillulae PL171]|uniref:Uncharacterized protein n=1 Tax=Catenaria anguillulae PL171 TaxID=765915 RepID=A0A1Y2HM06_9FUNG|nr:hypothetical protein BCR44DRAFT_1433876 [Catenaria anguillulae PL171]
MNECLPLRRSYCIYILPIRFPLAFLFLRLPIDAALVSSAATFVFILSPSYIGFLLCRTIPHFVLCAFLFHNCRVVDPNPSFLILLLNNTVPVTCGRLAPCVFVSIDDLFIYVTFCSWPINCFSARQPPTLTLAHPLLPWFSLAQGEDAWFPCALKLLNRPQHLPCALTLWLSLAVATQHQRTADRSAVGRNGPIRPARAVCESK